MDDKKEVKVVTAKEWLGTRASDEFRALCLRIGIEPTRRQVCKYRRKAGLAYKASR